MFIKPIVEAIKVRVQVRASEPEQSNDARTRMLKQARWRNFFGVFIVVVSSTVLYLNLIVFYMSGFFDSQHSLKFSTWGNPFSFGMSLDSLLNTLGMVLLCGIGEIHFPSCRCLFGLPVNEKEEVLPGARPSPRKESAPSSSSSMSSSNHSEDVETGMGTGMERQHMEMGEHHLSRLICREPPHL